MASNLWLWQRAQETVSPRNAFEITSIWLSVKVTISSSASVGVNP